MKAVYLGMLLLAGSTLGGCNRPFDVSKSAPHGRFAGVGLYAADRTWTKMRDADKPADKAMATVGDDQAVIVVVDSDTGEVRQCGNLSGYCVGMNPWSHALGKPQTMPLALSEHAPPKQAEKSEAPADVAVTNAMDAAPTR
ncbi:hypothetical protein BH10PSE14_BH10PSE14_30850 [soil metagenome]|jgi:hypothetical protein